RDPSDFDQPQSNGPMRIVILGDSFMWGAGIEMDETLPALLQARLGASHRVFNVSAPGWGIDQMYLAYEKYKRTLKPEVVVLAYVDDDVNRVLEAYRIYEKLNKPVLTIRGGTLTRRGPASEGEHLINGFARRSVLFSLFMREHFFLSDANPVIRQILTEISRDTREVGERFVVLRIPTIDNDSLQQRVRRATSNFPELSTEGSFLYLDPAAEFTDVPDWQRKFYLDDGHMNRAGNIFLLDYICRHAFQDC
ncbi:MAG: hypothetical protein OEU36_25410, partial [Gammaproteobacteria bacterium]|nr:hypothetical protein [Gammaproteobacteria bacterium]